MIKVVISIFVFISFLQAENNLRCKEFNSYTHAEKYITCLHEFIDKNDLVATKQLAKFYYIGQEPYKNYKKAIAWYLKVQAGDMQSQFSLGQIYLLGGYGIEKDHKKAAMWYKKAMKNGSLPAMANLANLYVRGSGVKKDCKKALNLYTKLAEKDIWYAQDSLGRLYLNGTCVKKDTKIANYWIKKGHQKEMEIYNAGIVKIEKNLTKRRSQ